MFDSQRWSRLISGEECPMCGDVAVAADAEPRLVANVPSGRVLLQNDAAFRGYCILAYHRHVTDLTELSESERSTLMSDVARIASGVHAICAPAKLNYAILGNEVPHLHVHIIPRYPDDGWWGRAIWIRPAAERRLIAPSDYDELRLELARRL